jgi:DNA-binding NarL/FixJ family response regulator
MATPYAAAVQVLPVAPTDAQDATGPIVIQIVIRLQQDAPVEVPDAAWELPPIGDGAEPLTPRERDVLALVADGLTNSEIADRLRLSHGTIKYYVSSILGKLGVERRLAAARHPVAQALQRRQRV